MTRASRGYQNSQQKPAHTSTGGNHHKSKQFNHNEDLLLRTGFEDIHEIVYGIIDGFVTDFVPKMVHGLCDRICNGFVDGFVDGMDL